MTNLLWLYFIIGAGWAIWFTLSNLTETRQPFWWLLKVLSLVMAWPAIVYLAVALMWREAEAFSDADA